MALRRWWPYHLAMQIICEGSSRISGTSDGIRLVQNQPHFHDEPVLVGDSFVDAYGCSIYGSVLQEDGGFRMWYQAWPQDYDNTDSLLVGCVESDDGIHWRRPEYGLIERGGNRDNHLTSLPFHAPSVFVDPDAEPDRRYRAFGYLHPERAVGFDVAAGAKGFYTAHSADGLKWTIDPGPVWHSADVITAAWDPWCSEGGAARIALKKNGPAVGQHRRRFFTSEWSRGQATAPVSAFVPDEADDLAARAHGCVSADYYGLSWIPTPGPTVAVVWTFRHIYPLGRSPDRLWNYGNFGQVDLELRYQTERGGRWLALPGRPDWVTAADGPEWARGGLYAASHAIDVGDETWLYVTGTREQHGWSGAGIDTGEARKQRVAAGGFAHIGRVTWPRNRLLGYRATLREQVDLLSGPVSAEEPAGLRINVTCGDGGHARAALFDSEYQPIEGFGFEECDGLSGDHQEGPVTWKGSADLPAAAGDLIARVEIEDASLWAFSFGSG